MSCHVTCCVIPLQVTCRVLSRRVASCRVMLVKRTAAALPYECTAWMHGANPHTARAHTINVHTAHGFVFFRLLELHMWGVLVLLFWTFFPFGLIW